MSRDATKLEYELRWRSRCVELRGKKDAWELLAPLVRRSCVVAVLVPRPAATRSSLDYRSATGDFDRRCIQAQLDYVHVCYRVTTRKERDGQARSASAQTTPDGQARKL